MFLPNVAHPPIYISSRLHRLLFYAKHMVFVDNCVRVCVFALFIFFVLHQNVSFHIQSHSGKCHLYAVELHFRMDVWVRACVRVCVWHDSAHLIQLIFIIIMITFSTPLVADFIYQYQNQNIIIHYTVLHGYFDLIGSVWKHISLLLCSVDCDKRGRENVQTLRCIHNTHIHSASKFGYPHNLYLYMCM